MKINNYVFDTIEEIEDKLLLENLNKDKTLIQVFSGFIEKNEIEAIRSILYKKNSQIPYIGCTTAGEIHDGNSLSKKIVISIMKFTDTTFKFYSTKLKDNHLIAKEFCETLITKNTKLIITFFDGINSNVGEVFDGVNKINSSIKIAGGNAADNGNFKETFVFTNTQLLNNGCVAVSLNSDILNVYTDYQFNWKPIGQEAIVTKVDKNRIYEINNMSAVDFYTKYLGKEIGNNLPYSATEFPLLLQKDNFDICRASVQKFDDGSLQIHGNLENGDKVRLAYGNINLILNSSKKSINNFVNMNVEALYIYSCSARKVFLQDEINIELSPFNKISDNCGFFSYGEFYHNGNRNNLLNVSMSVVALSEKKPLPVKKTETKVINTENPVTNSFSSKHYIILDALTNLSNTVIDELEAAKKQLKELAVRDYLTPLYNRRYFDELSQDFIYICKREEKPLSLIILDIDKFKEINDTYGHIFGDKILIEFSKILKNNIRKSDIISRFGGDEFVILLPFLDKVNAQEVAEKIRKKIEKKIFNIDDEKIKFTISLGVSTLDLELKDCLKEAYHHADTALYEAKKSGRNKSVLL